MGESTKSRVRTEREALAAALFEDADHLIDRMEEVQKTFPAMVAHGVEALNQAAAAAVKDVVAATQAEGMLVRQVEDASRKAYADIATAAKMATEQETSKVQMMLAKAVESALAKVGSEAAAPAAWRFKVAALQAISAAVIALGGGVVGAAWFGHTAPTDAEKAQLAAGRDFIRIYPQLDTATRDKVAKLIQQP
ncbi:hypothetical protein ACU4GI_33065 [Cupriavidus basilensis]